MDRIRVMVFEPGRVMHIENIKNTEEVYQNIVEGEIEKVNLDRSTVLIYNRDGKENGLPPNRNVGQDIICGTFFLATDLGKTGMASLSPIQMHYYNKLYGQPETITAKDFEDHMKYGSASVGKDEVFINNVNMRIADVDFDKVVESYKTPEFTEAKEFLKMMHQDFCDSFGTDNVEELIGGDDVFIHLPAVMKSRETGELCVGLVYVDTESSGEHWGTAFVFNNGFVDQSDMDRNNPMVEQRQAFGAYDYWYTPDYDGDIHTNRDYAPDEVKAILDYAIGSEEQTQGMNMDGM